MMNAKPKTISNVIDVDVSASERTPIRFNNDDDRVVYINVTDVGIVARMAKIIPKLREEQEKAGKILDGINAKEEDDDTIVEDLNILAERLTELDNTMRNLVDELFDAPISAAAVPSGSMYDPIEGTYRYDYIVTKLITLFGDSIEAEYKKAEKRINTHTDKYKKGTKK